MSATEITISYSDVASDVYAETGYMGKKKGDMETMAATGDDAAVLKVYFTDAAQELANVLVRVGNLSSLGDDSAKYALSLPGNWRSEVKTALERAMRQYIAACMVRQWFNLSKDDKAAYYAAVVERLAVEINRYVWERSRPTRS